MLPCTFEEAVEMDRGELERRLVDECGYEPEAARYIVEVLHGEHPDDEPLD